MGKSISGKELGRGISQRKVDGRYEARCMINGVKIHLYNMNLQQLKKDFEIEKAKVLRNEKNIRPNLTLADWMDEWFNSYKRQALKTEVSRQVYWRKVNNTYIAILGRKKVEDVSHSNIQTATNELLEKGYKVRSIREALGVIREALDVAIANKIIATNPCVSINMPNANEAVSERRVLSREEQKTFLEEVQHEYYNEAYQILLLTGMRIGEFSSLRWSDIDFDNKQIHIRRSLSVGYVNGKKMESIVPPKTANSYRSIPFFGETEKLFKTWREKQDSYKAKLGDRWRAGEELGDLVFTTTLGSPVTRYALSHNIEKVVSNINAKEKMRASMEGREPKEFEHLHPHAFRHTFATRCFEKGVDPVVVQTIMGHSNFATTLQYTHLLDDKLKEETSKVGNFFD